MVLRRRVDSQSRRQVLDLSRHGGVALRDVFPSFIQSRQPWQMPKSKGLVRACRGSIISLAPSIKRQENGLLESS